MKPIEKTGEDLFQKLRSRFSPVSMGDENADETATPSEARIFNFMYKDNDEEIGYVSISIIDNRSFKVYYGTDLIDRIENKTNWFNFLRQLRMFAKRNLMSFDARDLAKNQLEPRDFKFISQQNGTYKEHDVTVSESVMFGSRRKSYQTMENAKMIVNHRKSVDETIPGSRSRYIESIYIESADGERYKFPYNYLTGARVMTRHVNEGGNPYDELGKHITGMIKEMRDLSKFARRTKKYAMEDENAGNIRNSVVERFHSMKKQLGAMSVKEGYSRFVENFKSDEALVEDDTIKQIKERFTQQVFDTQLEDTLPAVMKAIKEAEMKQIAEKTTDKSVASLIKSTPLILRADDAADQMFRNTKFTDGAGLLGFILSDIASRAIGDNADEIANFASDAAERLQDKDFDQNDKQTAMRLAKKYMDDVKRMSSDREYKDSVRMDPRHVYGKMKKREGGFHESEAYEAWANDLVPENSVKKKSNEAVTQGTTGTQAPTNQAQAMRDPNLQKGAKNISSVAKVAGIQAPANQVAQGMAAQVAGKPMPRNSAMTTMGLGGVLQQALANDPTGRKTNMAKTFMGQMLKQGKFDEAAARSFLEKTLSEAPASTVINDPTTKTSTAFKAPGSTPAQPKGMQQWLYGTGQKQSSTGSSTVKPVTPLPQFDKTQSAMPDMDAMVSREKATISPTSPLVGKDPAVAKALAAQGFNPAGQRVTNIPNQTGAAKANIPVGSMPSAKMPSIPATTGAAKANIPVGSMPASTGYTVKAGDNLSKILTGKGMAATPDNLAKIAKLSGIKDPNMIKPGQTIKFK